MGLVAIFGAGVMGETLLSGLLRAGRSADDLVVTERRPDRAAELTAKYGVKVLGNLEAADRADTLVFVVKPQDMGALCDEIAGHVQRDNLVVSLAAGITTDFLESRLPDRAAELTAKYGVKVLGNLEAADRADTLVFVVKPQDMGALCDEIAGHVQRGNLVVSLAAGITTEFLESRLPDGVPVVRVMPNTPALVDQGMAAISPGAHCDEAHLVEAEQLLGTVGRVLRVEEKHQDAVTAVSGSGPAYVFYVAEAMIEAGVFLGMPRATATELVVQTLYGSATMLRETGEHPSVLRENVTSPGGTTVAALRTLDDHKVRAAFISALEAARDRSHELASGQ